MKTPHFIRPVTEEEQAAINAGLQSSDAFTLRRAQILRASQRGLRTSQIADQLSCDDTTALRAITAFNEHGTAALTRGSTRPHTTTSAFTADAATQLPEIVQQSPRTFGFDTSLWTLELLVTVAVAQGLLTRRVTIEGMRIFLRAHGIHWKRGKAWITSPDPAYKKKSPS